MVLVEYNCIVFLLIFNKINDKKKITSIPIYICFYGTAYVWILGGEEMISNGKQVTIKAVIGRQPRFSAIKLLRFSFRFACG